LIEDSP